MSSYCDFQIAGGVKLYCARVDSDGQIQIMISLQPGHSGEPVSFTGGDVLLVFAPQVRRRMLQYVLKMILCMVMIGASLAKFGVKRAMILRKYTEHFQ